MSLPSFSIIVPTYQRRDMVCEAVRAFCRLTYDGPVDIIVVVDGSTDGTAAALARLDCPFPLQVIEQENRGLAAARNRGALAATGDVLLFLDDDMICEPDLLQQHFSHLRDGADAVTGEIPIHPDSEPGVVTDRLTLAAAWQRGLRSSAFDLYGGHLSIRSDVFRQVCGFDEELHAGGYGGEDLDLGIRLSGRYDIRHNSAAVAWQKNLIGPSEHMNRARRLAESDLRLIAKHPRITNELLAHRGLLPTEKAPIALRLSRLPGLAPALAAIASRLAEVALGTRFQSSIALGRFYFAARAVSYWSAFQTRTGRQILHERQLG